MIKDIQNNENKALLDKRVIQQFVIFGKLLGVQQNPRDSVLTLSDGFGKVDMSCVSKIGQDVS